MDPVRDIVAAMPADQQAAVSALCIGKLAPMAGSELVTFWLKAECRSQVWPTELTNAARWPGLRLSASSWLECLFSVWLEQRDARVLDVDDLDDYGVALYADLASIATGTAAAGAVVATMVAEWAGSWDDLLHVAAAAAAALRES